MISSSHILFGGDLSSLSGKEPIPSYCDKLQSQKLIESFNGNDDVSNPKERTKIAVIVVGLESSGSKLATKVILKLAFNSARNNSKFRISGHGTYGYCGRSNNSPTADCYGVIHLSLPYNDCFPDLNRELENLHSNGIQTRIVIATRDQTTSLKSKLVDHQRSYSVATTEQHIATKILNSLMTTPPSSSATSLQNNVKTEDFGGSGSALDDEPIIFSYESLMLLRGPYVERLARSLKLELPSESKQAKQNSKNTEMYDLLDELGSSLIDGNPKWMTTKYRMWSWLVRGYRLLGFGIRKPAFATT